MFGTVVLAFDGSEHARNALALAAQVASTFNSQLHLVHTPQIDMHNVVFGAYAGALEPPISDTQIQEASDKIVAEAKELAEAAGVSIAEVHVSRDSPAHHILAVADAINADLIVMGRRGLGALGALALGSVSQSVSHGARCACLTVP